MCYVTLRIDSFLLYMPLFEKVLIPAGGVALFVGVLFAIFFFVLPQSMAPTPVVPNGDSGNPTDEPLGNIVVAQPVAGETISFPLAIVGQARVFENVFHYRVIDAANVVLAEHYAIADAKDIGEYGSFSLRVNYQQPTTSEGFVEVFSYSAKDGSVQDLQRIPVTFADDVVTKNISVFFVSRAGIETGNDCAIVREVVRRVPDTVAVAHAAMQELLAGVYPFEDVDGDYLSLIPYSARIRSLHVENGVATVVFVKDSFTGTAGSCTVGAIRAQIEATLSQFSSVTSVVIKEENVPVEEVLQP